MSDRPIYLDCHATTPMDPRVFESMTPYFLDRFGNAASRTHTYGWQAADAVVTGRKRVAALVGARGKEIVFTSGATESNNLAVRGAALALREQGDHLVTLVTEHSSVLDPCRRLEREGFHVTYLPVRTDGLVDLARLEEAVTDRTILVSVMAANNEVGVLQPLAAIGRIAKGRNAVFHTDATQAPGLLQFDVDDAGVDLVSISAHKIYGPKGVGALYVRRRHSRARLTPMLEGGGHEWGIRAGTLNVPGIVGFGRAAEICVAERDGDATRIGQLRGRLWQGLTGRLADVRVNGSLQHRLPNNLNVSFGGVEGEALLMGLTDIAVSFGSACASASVEPSHVLAALGVPDAQAHAALRFGLGRFTTQDEIDRTIERVAEVVTRLRAISPLREDAVTARPEARVAGPD